MSVTKCPLGPRRAWTRTSISPVPFVVIDVEILCQRLSLDLKYFEWEATVLPLATRLTTRRTRIALRLARTQVEAA